MTAKLSTIPMDSACPNHSGGGRQKRLALCLAVASLVTLAPMPGHAACQAVRAKEMLEVARKGYDALLTFQPELALAQLNMAVDHILCLQDVPPPQLLSQTWQWMGVARRFSGDLEGASQAFTQALAVQPDLPWNSAFGELGLREFEAARARQRCTTCAQVGLAPLRIEADLYLDGKQIPRDSRRVSTAPGPHLLQVVQTDQVIWAQYLEAEVPPYNFRVLAARKDRTSGGAQSPGGNTLERLWRRFFPKDEKSIPVVP